ncbi:MAG: photosystem I reaction center protein subunit XI [Spirulinaceae cyanobacterium]
MAYSRDVELIKPYNGDPQLGHLSTPISDSDFTRTFIGNLPAYRKGLAPILRGLEIGMAHGYFIGGPWVVFGPLRDSEFANLGGLINGMTLILIGTACLAIYGIVAFKEDESGELAKANPMQTAEGWSQFTAGFFVGGMGGAFFAYFLLENFGVVDGILNGSFN